MIVIPDEFKPIERHKYPQDNEGFEPWFAATNPPDINGREYLGVMWTAYYKNHNYGNDKAAIDRLQFWIYSLPKDKKYYSICQFDLGPRNDLSHLDIKLFCMSGGPEGFIPIPLVCSPHPYQFPDVKKDILCSFIGRMTDPARTELVKWGNGRRDCYITSAPHPLEQYCKILARSKFVICMRGFGPSSFRVGEALQYGATPFIFSHFTDVIFERKLPFHIWTYLTMGYGDFEIAQGYFKKYEYSSGEIMKFYRTYYTFEGLRAYIIQKLMEDAS